MKFSFYDFARLGRNRWQIVSSADFLKGNTMSKLLKGLVASAGLASGAVFAAVPADVTTAIAAAQTDGTTVATAMLVMVAAFLGFRIIRRQMH